MYTIFLADYKNENKKATFCFMTTIFPQEYEHCNLEDDEHLVTRKTVQKQNENTSRDHCVCNIN